MSKITDIIPPEVKDDALAAWLTKLAAQTGVKIILEVGSSDGSGSTTAIFEGMVQNPDFESQQLHCLEVSKPRFAELQRRFAKHFPRVWLYNFCASAMEHTMSESDVKAFYNEHVDFNLRKYPLPEVLRWRRQDIDYCKHNLIPDNGIHHIKTMRNIEEFDLVFLDGGAFNGLADFMAVGRPKYFVLDDISDVKNADVFSRLSGRSDYRLMAYDFNLRNGYGVFERL